MPYVERDENGAVVGLYRQEQAGYADEFLEEDNEEVKAFKAKTEKWDAS